MKLLGMSTLLSLAVASAVGAGATIDTTAAQAAEGWQPQKPVEFVIMAGPGGGADQLARLIQSVIEKNGWSAQPFIPVNKGGGSGAEGLRYLLDKSGDAHVIMATLNSFFTTPLRQPDIGVDVTTFTPIAKLADDPFTLWVHVDDPAKSVDDWVAAVKEAGEDYTVGGTGTGQEDSLVFAMLEEAYGLQKLNYVPFEGGGDVAKNLIGKHIAATVNNPAEQLGFFEAGLSRPLANTTKGRLDVYPDVPTFSELGHEIFYGNQRLIVGPPDMPAEAQAFYIDLFQKVHESPEWIKYTEEQALARDFIAGEDQAADIKTQVETHSRLLKQLGQIE